MAKDRLATQQSLSKRRPASQSIEWLTVLLVVVVHVIYVVLLMYAEQLPFLFTTIALCLMFTLHSSLQHEVLHGHPMPSRFLSELLVSLPIGLFIPYLRFKQLHLQHHCDPNLTDPYDDPESNFLYAEQWNNANKLSQSIYLFNGTLFGCMLVGPALSLSRFYKKDLSLVLKGDKAVQLAWVHHFVWLVVLLLLLVQFSSASLWLYLISAYAALSTLKIRTYLEHRPHEKIAGRSAIVESTGLMALLFLNNNYHAAHHANPKLTWYKLPAFYAENKAEITRKNCNYLYANYWDIFKRYFLKRKEPIVHPLLSKQMQSNDAHSSVVAERPKT